MLKLVSLHASHTCAEKNKFACSTVQMQFFFPSSVRKMWTMLATSRCRPTARRLVNVCNLFSIKIASLSHSPQRTEAPLSHHANMRENQVGVAAIMLIAMTSAFVAPHVRPAVVSLRRKGLRLGSCSPHCIYRHMQRNVKRSRFEQFSMAESEGLSQQTNTKSQERPVGAASKLVQGGGGFPASPPYTLVYQYMRRSVAYTPMCRGGE
jgi:hypothetical protein